MSDLISRCELFNRLATISAPAEANEFKAKIYEVIQEMETADRPQGEWKPVKASIYPYGYDVECSVCGHRMGSSFGYKFCPMCGAHMKGADDEV